ncbi:MAG: hypothetical protein AAF944_00545 [Bacteroidota bacterium]
MKRVVLISVLYSLMSISMLSAQSYSVNVNKLVEELQILSDSSDTFRMVWWIPSDFWAVSLAEDPNTSQRDIDEIVRIFEQYTIAAIIDGKVGVFGGITYRDREEIEAEIMAFDNNLTPYKPIAEDKLDADTKVVLSMLKPVLANMLGQMGENMQFFAFSKKIRGKNNEVIGPTDEGVFNVALGEEQFSWRLPLGSLLPPKYCPYDQEELSGAWKYCPHHGEELLSEQRQQ